MVCSGGAAGAQQGGRAAAFACPPRMAGEARSDYARLFVCVLAVLAMVAFGGEITRGVIMVVVGAVVSRRWSSKSPEPAPLTKEGEAFLRAVDGGHLNVVQSLADRHFIAAGEVDVPRTSVFSEFRP